MIHILPNPSEFASIDILEKTAIGSKAILISGVLLLIAFFLMKISIPRAINYLSTWSIVGSGIGFLSGIAGIVILGLYTHFILATIFIVFVVYACIANS